MLLGRRGKSNRRGGTLIGQTQAKRGRRFPWRFSRPPPSASLGDPTGADDRDPFSARLGGSTSRKEGSRFTTKLGTGRRRGHWSHVHRGGRQTAGPGDLEGDEVVRQRDLDLV